MGICQSKKNIKHTNINKNLIINKKTDIKILYLEDVEIQVEIMKFIVQNYINSNITIIWTKTIEESYDYIQNNNVDLIFVDRQLENNRYGEELIEKIDENNVFPLNKIIIISNLTDLSKVENFIRKGVFYILKPMDIPTLLTTMKEVFHH